MTKKPRDKIRDKVTQDLHAIHTHSLDTQKAIDESLQDCLEYLHMLIAQIPQSGSGPLITKTPKVLRKKAVQRIDTIPENEVVDNDYTMSEVHIKQEKRDSEVASAPVRSKREASKKASDIIKKQQSLTLSVKLRREDGGGQQKRGSRAKRKKSMKSSSEDDESSVPLKQSKVEDHTMRDSMMQQDVNMEDAKESFTDKTLTFEEKPDATMTLRRSSRKVSSQRIAEPATEKAIDDSVIAPTGEDIEEETSMYEDAMGKPMPIMNSTMNANTTVVLQRMMNATVVLEALPTPHLNETVTLKKKSIQIINAESVVKNNSKSEELKGKSPRTSKGKSPQTTKAKLPAGKVLQVGMHQQLRAAMANKEFDELLTDDESSPEIKKRKQTKRQRTVKDLDSSSDDEVLSTPAKTVLRDVNARTAAQDQVRNTYKANALFSPYAKESVKKRVEAFEQVGMNSPKHVVEVDAPTRLTRTKTRAIAAAQAEMSENSKGPEKTVAQKLARKSLAKAMKISLAKQRKESDDVKENKQQSAQKHNKVLSVDKVPKKQNQKTTPLGKSRLPVQFPASVNRLATTPSNNAILYSHTKSTTRGNIVTTIDSFIQAPRTASKPTSAERLEEKKRKPNDEDVKRKREEALRVVTEEKKRKRQEKELKNKLAREAKEKQDIEKRQRTEKEREEKARIAQQILEKQREDMEKKRLLQLQRAQEIEERRKLEEQLRLQRLQEQEEAERVLAEQRRREQEADKRREAEARAQQQAAADANRLKNQILLNQNKQNKHHGPTNYILDSEPDDDESDDESKPKHSIPHWAQSHVRKVQLMIQRFVPEKAVFKFFDTRKCTPDLTEIFHGIDRSKLTRTSSAIWKSPPRFSMMERN